MKSAILAALRGIAALLVIDATLGRYLLKLTTTFRKTIEEGGAPQSRTLVVYLPGILFDGDDSVAEIKPAFLKRVSQGMFISYGFWQFKPKEVARYTAATIGRHHSLSGYGDIDQVIIVGASFGGRIAADVASILRNKYGWSAKAISIVLIDTPCGIDTFKEPGRTASLVLRWLYIGPLVSLVVRPITRALLVPPYDDEIEDGIDKQVVKQRAVRRMAKFSLSITTDQQRYLTDERGDWTYGLHGLRVIYLSCDWKNITVEQPAAWLQVKSLVTPTLFTHYSVPSPHCGFTQLPNTWSTALDAAMADLVDQ